MPATTDASCLHYAVLIEQAEVLPALYGRIHVPLAVYRELTARGTPAPVRSWMAAAPAWVEVCAAPVSGSPDLDALGRGEQEATLLAEATATPLLIATDR